MSKSVTQLLTTDSFQTWVDKTNEIAGLFSEVVTAKANTTGDVTSGNVSINGILSANTLTTSVIRGGSVATSANLVISSNVSTNGALFSTTANVSVIAANITISANTTNPLFAVFSNTTYSRILITSSNTDFTSNVNITGKSLIVPAGNTSNRPSSIAGSFRYNSELNIMEYYGSSWTPLAAGNGSTAANNVTFANNANITSTTVQNAINEVYNVKVSKNGDKIFGFIEVNLSGANAASPLTNTLMQEVQEDGVRLTHLFDTSANNAVIVGRRNNGTIASKTAVQASDTLFSIQGYGHDGNSYSNSSRVSIDFNAEQNWANTSHGTGINFNVTANNSTSIINVLKLTATKATVNSSMDVLQVLTANSLTVNTNLSVGANLTAINISANIISVNTSISVNGVNVRRAANTTVDGVVSYATTSEYRVGTEVTKALQTAQVWAAATPVNLGSLSGSVSLDLATFINAYITGVGNITLSGLSNAKPGQGGRIDFIHSGAPRTITLSNTYFETSGGYSLALSNTAGARDSLAYSISYNGKCFITVIGKNII